MVWDLAVFPASPSCMPLRALTTHSALITLAVSARGEGVYYLGTFVLILLFVQILSPVGRVTRLKTGFLITFQLKIIF